MVMVVVVVVWGTFMLLVIGLNLPDGGMGGFGHILGHLFASVDNLLRDCVRQTDRQTDAKPPEPDSFLRMIVQMTRTRTTHPKVIHR